MNDCKAECNGGVRHLSVDLDRLKPGTQVRFPGEDELVTLMAVAQARSGSSTSTGRPGRAGTYWPRPSWTGLSLGGARGAALRRGPGAVPARG